MSQPELPRATTGTPPTAGGKAEDPANRASSASIARDQTVNFEIDSEEDFDLEPKEPKPLEKRAPEVDLPVGMVFGPYRLLAKLGQGGMGAVYKAVHIKLDKLMALKILRKHMLQEPDAVARFEREMKAVGRVNNQYIVQAHDAGEIDGSHYLAMEYVDGSDLLKLVRTKGPLSVHSACKAVRQAALALLAAHEAGLVHRDVKPSNLLADKKGQIRLLDLGLALLGEDPKGGAAGTELTMVGECFGTPDFMAPEQWDDSHGVDGRTDLYALGCTLYFLLTGHAPYENQKTAVRKMTAHVHDAIPDLKAARGAVPDGVNAIYRKLMAKAPIDRYQTASDLAGALLPFTKKQDGGDVLDTSEPDKPGSFVVGASGVKLSLSPSSSSPALPTFQLASQSAAPVAKAVEQVPPAPPVSAPPPFPEIVIHTDSSARLSQVRDALSNPPQSPGMAAATAQLHSQQRPLQPLQQPQPMSSQRWKLWIGLAGGLSALIVVICITLFIMILNPPPRRAADPDAADSSNSGKKSATEKKDQQGTDAGTAEAGPPVPAKSRDAIAAAWALSVQGSVELRDAKGEPVALLGAALPDTPFLLSTVSLNSPSIGDSGLENLAGSAVTYVDVSGSMVTDAGLQKLAEGCKEIKLLNIGGRREDGRTPASLKHFSKLESVSISGEQTTEEGLTAVNELRDLKSLTIEPPLSVAALLELHRLRRCQQLALRSAYREDAVTLADGDLGATNWPNCVQSLELNGQGVSPSDHDLRKMARALHFKRLTLTGGPQARYTNAGVDALRKLRPDLWLIVDGQEFSPTGPPPTSIPDIPETSAPATPPGTGGPQSSRGFSEGNSPVPVVGQRLFIAPPPVPAMKAGTPLSPRALVGRPTTIRDLRSWSLELTGHSGTIFSVAYSPSGKFIASVGASDDKIMIWRVDLTGDKSELRLDRVLIGESGQITDVAWSLDSQTLAVCTQHGQDVTLYDVNTGRQLRNVSLGGGAGRSLAWSPNGKALAAAHMRRLALIEPASGAIQFSKTSVSCAAGCWSPDGSQFATLDEEGQLKFWSPASLDVETSLRAQNASLGMGIAWSSDGEWIATGGQNEAVKVWNAKLRRVVRDLGQEQGGSEQDDTTSVAWEPKPADAQPPRLLITGRGMATIWDAVNGKKLVTLPVNAHTVRGSWSPDGRQVAFGAFDRVRIFDATTGALLTESSLEGRPLIQGTEAHATPDGKLFRTLYGTDLLIFNGETGEYVKRVGNLPNMRMTPSPKDDWLVFSDNTREVVEKQLLLVDTATYEQRVPLTGHTGPVTAVSWAPDGSRLATASTDRTVCIWKPSGERLQTLTHKFGVRNVTWSPDGKQLATCAEDDIVRLWDASTGKENHQYDSLSSPSSWGSNGIAWSPVGDLIAIASQDAQARILDLKSGKVSALDFTFWASMQSISWSGDAKQLLVSNGAEVGYRVTSAKAGQTLYGYGLPIQWLADKRRVLTGQAMSLPLQAVDTRKGTRIGVLYPRLHSPEGHEWLCIGGAGHYRGSEGVEKHLVYVALHKDGSMLSYSPAEFSAKFGWKNDPAKAGLLALKE